MPEKEQLDGRCGSARPTRSCGPHAPHHAEACAAEVDDRVLYEPAANPGRLLPRRLPGVLLNQPGDDEQVDAALRRLRKFYLLIQTQHVLDGGRANGAV